MRMRQLLPGVGFCFYLLYALTVFVFLLWFKFPADAFRKRAEADLNRLTASLHWQISKIGLALPADIRCSGIKISGKASKDSPFSIDSFSLRPDFAAWQKSGSWAAWYRLPLLAGSISGRAELTADKSSFDYKGEAQGISLDSSSLKAFFQNYGRKVSGSLSGNFFGSWKMGKEQFPALQGRMRIEKGTVSLKEPVLGLAQLDFSQASCNFRSEAGQLHLEDGTLDSRLFAAEFSGTVQTDVPIFSSAPLRLRGLLAPRPEFLASIGNPMMSGLLKQQLRNGKLHFVITGTLQEPGIVFSGLPADFNRQLGSKGR